MHPFTAIFVTVLSTLGVLYVLELKDTNPSVGIPLMITLGVFYIIGALTVWSGNRK